MCYDDEHKINKATMPRYFGIVLRFRYHSGPHFLITLHRYLAAGVYMYNIKFKAV